VGLAPLPHILIAFTVPGALSTNVPPPESCLAVPEPGTGVLPSVVYQMEVLPSGCGPLVCPGSVRVPVTG
jgi:hypothetical protein